MQQMWFLESEEDRELRRLWKPRSVVENEKKVLLERASDVAMKGAKRDWIFRVQVKNSPSTSKSKGLNITLP